MTYGVWLHVAFACALLQLLTFTTYDSGWSLVSAFFWLLSGLCELPLWARYRPWVRWGR